MPVYETDAELRAEEAAIRKHRAEIAACLATGQPCICPGTTHDPDKRKRGLYLRAASGLLHGAVRYIGPKGCRWCGYPESGHCRRTEGGKGLHLYEPPTVAQLAARERAGIVGQVASGWPGAKPQPIPEIYQRRA